ncbi:unnamed protein product, partial [Amoebophrya sp. A25]|eukprot:GSA25T00004317001.1
MGGIVLPLFGSAIIRLRAFWYLQPYINEAYMGLAQGLITSLMGAAVFLATGYDGVWGQGGHSLLQMIENIRDRPREVQAEE